MACGIKSELQVFPNVIPNLPYTMPSKARLLIELTRIHWFPVGSDFTFWPFGKVVFNVAYLWINCGSSCLLAWGFLSAAYHVALPMNEVLKNTLFYAFLGTLIHSAGCVINDMLDRDLDRKVGKSQFLPDYRWSSDPFNVIQNGRRVDRSHRELSPGQRLRFFWWSSLLPSFTCSPLPALQR
jgi:hypothetical protein